MQRIFLNFFSNVLLLCIFSTLLASDFQIDNSKPALHRNYTSVEEKVLEHFSKGFTLMSSKKYDDALIYFNCVRNIQGISNTDMAHSYYHSNLVLYKLNRSHEAWEAKALAHFYWGISEIVLNNNSMAIWHFDIALGIQEISSETKSKLHHNRGKAYKNLNYSDRAIEDMSLAYFHWALTLKENNELDEACKSLDYGLNLKGISIRTTIRIYNSLGLVLFQQRKYDEAIQKFILAKEIINQHNQCSEYEEMINISIEWCNEAMKPKTSLSPT